MTAQYVTTTHANGAVVTEWKDPSSIPPSTRIITTDEFMDRIPRAAWETISTHASAEATAFVTILNARASIDLDNDKTVYYVNKIKQAGLITQQEHDGILA